MTLSDTLTSFRSSRWFKLVWVIPIVIVGLAIIVIIAEIVRAQPAVQSFLRTYPGFSGLPSFAPVGFPAWVEWQHGLNVFFLLFIVRSGWLVRTTKRPNAFWTRNNNGPIRTKGAPVRISLNLWLHLSFDTLWVLNGIVFYVLIFCTGQWVRIIPTRWDIFPNAISAGLQYASLHWPTESGWSNYNALQTISYFLIVFIAAPLAIITGLRISPGLAGQWRYFEKAYPITVARKIHFPVMIFFVAFTIVHVTLVFATGALNNLNHMYGGRNDESWVGFWIFAGTLALMIAAWIGARSLVLRSIAGVTGTVGR